VFALDQKTGERTPHPMPSSKAMPGEDNGGKHSGIMPASGKTATRGWIDLPQWRAHEISPHKRAWQGDRHEPFRLHGDRRFDRVGAVGRCAALSATQDVMARNSADIRFGSEAGCNAEKSKDADR
jgi:hypothetical protein